MNRIAIGLAIGAIVLGSLYIGEWYTLALLSTLLLFGQHESYRISSFGIAKQEVWRGIAYTTIGTAFFAYFAWLMFTDRHGVLERPLMMFSLLSLGVIYFLIRILRLYVTVRRTHARLLIDSILYVPIPLILSYWVCVRDGGFSSSILIGIIILIWTIDTGAYYFGRAIGRTKLFPRISPNKTWEGAIGGLATALLITQILAQVLMGLSSIEWLMVAVIVWIFGSYGDLIESHYKRLSGVKDSGRLLGDHGGVLDRFDAFLCAVPFVAVYLWLLQ